MKITTEKPRAAEMLAAGIAAAAISGCAQVPAGQPRAEYDQPHRPQLSYTPERNWMNDPNGLVHHDGEYHMFYQYNPNGAGWGDMSWGHAVSPDLLHWRELPLALTVEKDDKGGVTQMFFSGSAVVDTDNTSGLGQPGKPAMVAMYTSVYPQDFTLANGRRVRAGQQSQSLAYSLDKGRSWTQYAGNPVIEQPPAPYADEYREFRDPKVFWYAPERKWVMVAVLAHRHKTVLYSSTDLRNWRYMSEFGPAGAVGGMWECPDLFELAVDGDPARSKWVMVMNLNPGGPAGGSGAQYFVGRFDGATFQAERDEWLDGGADFYAAVSWNGAPDGRRVLLGWMSNWLYAHDLPAAAWRGAQSVPRELGLRTIDGQVRLTQQPVTGFDGLRRAAVARGGRAVAEGVTPLPQARGPAGALDIDMLLAPGGAARAGVTVHAGPNGEGTVVGYDRERGEVYVDRRNAGDASFHAAFAARHAAPMALRDGAIRLRILVDRSSVTVFAGEGELTLSSQVFPRAGSDGVALFAEGGAAELRALQIWPLASIWAKPAEIPEAIRDGGR
ncbi:glycoside hydrolase family 32 protein [Pseudoduganella namucuonensis]|nr:glycoside hydrolase family 32 protein [Pseudoduganella namucuonensis]